MPEAAGPHANQPVRHRGAPLEGARAAVVALHGRGATAESILELAEHLPTPGVAWLAPQAAGNTWYPYPFTAPISSNEPFLTSALESVGAVVRRVEAAGVPAEKTVLLGFSQGACLALEYAARNARRYGGVVGLSGGLIGPDGTTWPYPANLAGTPVFLGCSDVDAHIPRARVEESAGVLARLGGAVTARLYPGMGHTVNEDELGWIRQLLDTFA
ncbi:MAG TPA: alpha/beta hydrolase [Chloroflexota bacterium]|nr:alpha/beta hydrolase [Chloroflexota bacterium]